MITNGSMLLPLSEMNGTIELKMRDSSGLREFDYEFEVYRVPTGISKWKLTEIYENYEESIPLLNAAGSRKYFAEVSGPSEVVQLHIEGEATLTLNNESISDFEGVLNLSPLYDGLNLFVLEVTVGEKLSATNLEFGRGSHSRLICYHWTRRFNYPQ